MFLVVLARPTIEDLLALLDSKLIDPKSAAVRFRGISIALKSVFTTRLSLELVSVVKENIFVKKEMSNDNKWIYDSIALPEDYTGKNIYCVSGRTETYRTHLDADLMLEKIYGCPIADIRIEEQPVPHDPSLLAIQYWNDSSEERARIPGESIWGRDKNTPVDVAKASVAKYGYNNPYQNGFCQTKVDTCPPEMLGGCSRYFSVGADGDFCRELFNSQTDAQKDVAIAGYCSRNNTIDCKCANRSNDGDYVKLKQGNPFPDSCWYIPCANQERYLVPSEFRHNPDCPQNICQIVFDISQAHDVDVDHIKNDINCDFGGGKYPNHSPYLLYYVIGFGLAAVLLVIYAMK